MKVVILQPSYIPWRGYFHQIQKADTFVFYDCVQYDKHGWRNRNKIKTSQGEQWLSVPVNTHGCVTEGRAICEVPISWDTRWNKKHAKSISQSYSKAPFYREHLPLIEQIYRRRDEKLSDFTCTSTELIARALGIRHTQFVRSSRLPAEGTKTDRLLSLLRYLGATHYISGPSARSYLEIDKLRHAGITTEFLDYNYPKYPQINGAFIPDVTILDLLFNVGSEAPRFIWGK